jgi:ribosomal protein S18 acetylase RimI-like enzyme
MDITIRRAEERDSERITDMLHQVEDIHSLARPDIFKPGGIKYAAKELSGIIGDSNRPIFVAESSDSGVVGYCFCVVNRYSGHSVFTDRVSLYIDDYCVDESCRGQGVGKRLFAAVAEYARSIGAYDIELNVWECNSDAIKFYEGLGFGNRSRRMELIL